MWRRAASPRAAERLNYTQSTITFQMGQLEGELSAQLFEKVGRRMVLSQAGRRLLPYVDQVLDAVDQMRFFQEDLTQCRGEITIGVAETLLCYRLPPGAEGLSPAGPGGAALPPVHELLRHSGRPAGRGTGRGDLLPGHWGLGDQLTTYPWGSALWSWWPPRG